MRLPSELCAFALSKFEAVDEVLLRYSEAALESRCPIFALLVKRLLAEGMQGYSVVSRLGRRAVAI